MSVIVKHLTYGFIVLNMMLTLWRISAILPRLTAQKFAMSTLDIWQDDDGQQLLVEPLDQVAMTLHESTHFSLDNLSDPITKQEWETIAVHPDGFGRTRLGPDHNLYVLTFYHQFHCLWRFQAALANRTDPGASPHHVLHCLNYLRQTFLCEAADLVEAGDFMRRDFEVDRVADTVVCRDWERLYNLMDEAYSEWAEWRLRWN